MGESRYLNFLPMLELFQIAVATASQVACRISQEPLNARAL